MSPENALSLALAVPALGAVLVALAGRSPNLRETVTLLTGVVLLGIVTTLIAPVMAGDTARVERLKGVGAFTYAEEFDRQAGDGAH